MPYRPARKTATAGRTIAALFQYSSITLMNQVPQPYHSPKGKRLTIATIASRQYAVEHVNATTNRPQQVSRLTYAHQISRAINRQMLNRGLNRLHHQLMRLADADAAYGVTGAGNLGGQG